MKRFKNILLVANKKESNVSELKRVLLLAQENNAQLTIAETIPDIPLPLPQGERGLQIQEALNAVAKTRHDELQGMIEELQPGIDIRPLVLQGRPVLELIRSVLKHKFDLVIKTSEPEESFRAKIFGSNDIRLLRKCPCPVWLLKPGEAFPNRAILAAIELESIDNEDAMDGLNRQILEMATSLARRESSELHIVNAWQIVGGSFLNIPMAEQIKGDVQQWINAQKQEVEVKLAQFNELLEKHLRNNKLENLHCQVHSVEGNAEDVILKIVAEQNIDLVVMGTVARTHLAGFLMGNTAEHILSQVACSVLTVKPAHFSSPVTLES